MNEHAQAFQGHHLCFFTLLCPSLIYKDLLQLPLKKGNTPLRNILLVLIGIHLFFLTYYRAIAAFSRFQGLRQPPHNFLFHGPPGTGKTLLVEKVGTILEQARNYQSQPLETDKALLVMIGGNIYHMSKEACQNQAGTIYGQATQRRTGTGKKQLKEAGD